MKDSEEPGLAPAALGEMRASREDDEYWCDSAGEWLNVV